MTNIKLDSQVLSNVKSENLINMLNSVIDKELDKDTSQVNTSLVEECVNAILQIEQDEDSSFRVLVPLMRSDDFLKSIMPKENITPWKRLNVFARVAVVAAIVATGTFSVNAAVRAITDYDIIENLSTKISTLFENNSKDNEDLLVVTTTQKETTTLENNTQEVETEKTTQTVENTTVAQTTTEKTAQQTTKPVVTEAEKTTIPAQHMETTVPNGKEKEKLLNSIFVDSSKMKTAYIFGEELNYDGLKLTKIYSDGSNEALSYKDCTRTKNLDTSKVGDYTITLVYENVTMNISVTVRPTEDTRHSDVCSNDDYDYFLTSKGAIITKYKGNGKMIILDTIDGKDVYSIEQNVFKDSDLISFSSSSCKKIMNSAFEDCKMLKNVSLPSCQYIGEKAFRHTALEEVTIPSGVTEIHNYTFDGCESLINVEFKGKVTEIGRCAFNECFALENISGTKHIQKVDDLAFYDDKLLEFDTTLDNLNYAGDYAFAFCTRAVLDTIDNMTHIGDGAFKYCYNISSVHIGKETTSVPDEAFRGARITSLAIDEGVKAIENYAFMSSQITTLTLPDSLRAIGTYAFYSNKITTVKGGEKVETVGSMAFYPSKKLTMYVLTPSSMLEYAKDNNITYVAHNKDGETVLPEDEL